MDSTRQTVDRKNPAAAAWRTPPVRAAREQEETSQQARGGAALLRPVGEEVSGSGCIGRGLGVSLRLGQGITPLIHQAPVQLCLHAIALDGQQNVGPVGNGLLAQTEHAGQINLAIAAQRGKRLSLGHGLDHQQSLP